MELNSVEAMCLLIASEGLPENMNKREVESMKLISISLPAIPISVYISCQQASTTTRLEYFLSLLPQIQVSLNLLISVFPYPLGNKECSSNE